MAMATLRGDAAREDFATFGFAIVVSS
jgi:hypothetical protein